MPPIDPRQSSSSSAHAADMNVIHLVTDIASADAQDDATFDDGEDSPKRPSTSSNKRRKLERACDFCRRRKTKCDGPKMENNVCTNCVQNRKTCTYVETSKPRGPPKAYVTALEDRVEAMEALFKRLRPEQDFTEILGPPVLRDSWKADDSCFKSGPAVASSSRLSDQPSSSLQVIKQSPSPSAAVPSTSSSSTSPVANVTLKPALGDPRPQIATRSRKRSGGRSGATTDRSGSDGSDDDDDHTSSETEEMGELSLLRGVKKLTLRGLEVDGGECHCDNQLRHHGKSSPFMLIGKARRLKEKHRETVARGKAPARDRDGIESRSASPHAESVQMREEFWHTPNWEDQYDGMHITSPSDIPGLQAAFPPDDLAQQLIDLYFEQTNIFYPLLHRPTFRRQFQQRLHERDVWFACLCLSIFAVAARWSNDPRVLSRNRQGEASDAEPKVDQQWLKAGWKYADAAIMVHRVRRSVMHPACLFEVQSIVLFTTFLRGTAHSPVGWLLISAGLRKAQDVGAHRRKVYGRRPTVDEEQWKRAYWLLVSMDRNASLFLGRSPCSREEDLDLDLPLEVDDEYWENDDPELAFKQPACKPSTVTGFNLYVKLTQIKAFAMRTIYAIDKSKVLLGLVGPHWRERIIKELNVALTEWGDAVPPHLRWSPNMENQVFANQAAVLYTSYYLTQILIYRPFIRQPHLSDPSRQPDANSPFAALAICSNAAKACTRILDVQLVSGFSDISMLIAISHVCAAILLMQIWAIKVQEKERSMEDVKPPRPPSAQSTGQQIEPLLADVKKLIKALEWAEPRWELAGKMLKHIQSSMPGSETEKPVSIKQPDLLLVSDPQPVLHDPRQQRRPPVQPSYPDYSTYKGRSSYYGHSASGAGYRHYALDAQLYTMPQSSVDDDLWHDEEPPGNTDYSWQWFSAPSSGYQSYPYDAHWDAMTPQAASDPKLTSWPRQTHPVNPNNPSSLLPGLTYKAHASDPSLLSINQLRQNTSRAPTTMRYGPRATSNRPPIQYSSSAPGSYASEADEWAAFFAEYDPSQYQ